MASKNPIQFHEQKRKQSPKKTAQYWDERVRSLVARCAGDSLGSNIITTSQPGKFNTSVKVANPVSYTHLTLPTICSV